MIHKLLTVKSNHFEMLLNVTAYELTVESETAEYPATSSALVKRAGYAVRGNKFKVAVDLIFCS